MSDWEPQNMWEDYDQDFDQEEGDFEFEGALIHETDKAYLIALTAKNKEIWIPKSQVGDVEGEIDEDTGELHMGELYTFTIPAWLAEKKEL